MGLRTASARRPHVMVMAPALTKPTQSNGFKLTSSSPTKSSATSLTSRTNDDHDVYNSLEGEPCKDLVELDCIDLGYAADNLNTLALVSEIFKKNSNLSSVGDSGVNILELGGMMNSNPLHMGDDTEKMGLQKTAGLDVNCFKDRSIGDIDQLIFNNIEAGLPDTDVGNDIGQNVDDLMNVFKSIGSGSDRLEGGESDSMFPLSSADLPGSFSSLEKELFNDVDVMSMSMEEQLLDGANSLKETHTNEFLSNLQKKHAKLERKLQFMMRRLRKVQAKHMGQHFSEEVAGIYEQVHRSLRRAKDTSTQLLPPPPLVPLQDQLLDPTKFGVVSVPTNPSVIVEKLKPISKNSAKSLVRKLEMSTTLQANAVGRQRHMTRYFGSGSVETNSLRSSLIGATIIPQWSTENVHDLQRVTGLLHTETRLVQQDLDSEATVSSSGGESCDEMQSYNNTHQQFLAIQKRAAWRYAVERAAIASRWTWLKAQIGDLEYRIRQYSDLYKQIRAGKGGITLGGESPPRNIPTSPSTVNGYRGQLPGASPMKSLDSTANGTVPIPDVQCTRTRPLVNFRKRKLLQTWGLHTISKKAARPATMRCGCVPPGLHCALCTGRTDPTRPRDLPDYLSTTECLSRLDSSFHPVFSLLEDASASTHFDAIMKTSEWQHKSSKPNMKIAKYMLKGTEKSGSSVEHQPKKQTDHRRKYNRLIKPSTINALTAKIKNKFRGRKPGVHSSLSRLRRKRHSEKLALSHLQSATLESGNEEHDLIGNSRSVKSRSSSPLLSMQPIPPGYKRNSRISSYDIDNIVIPYSVAASTRVEKLQYKEILTPKWRIVDSDVGCKVKSNGVVVTDPEPESDNEDLVDEAALLRHEKSELEERKKFLSYLKFPYGYSRSRAHKRIDSRAESSGCNTPDPMSPHTGEALENTISPLTSPPATPLSINTEDGGGPLPSINVLRKRTISQSKAKDKEALREEVSFNLAESDEVFPFESRIFPLDDDTYDHMLKLMPENHQFKTNYRAQDCTSPSSCLGDRANSPDSESTESAVGDEDPNDPEWIDMENIKDRYRR